MESVFCMHNCGACPSAWVCGAAFVSRNPNSEHAIARVGLVLAVDKHITKSGMDASISEVEGELNRLKLSCQR